MEIFIRIPPGYTQAEVLEILERVAQRLASRFIFSYYTREDIVQEAILLGIQGLENYKENKPLENFLFVHVKNRLCTLKRDKYMRPNSDKPCFNCPFNAYIKKSDFCKKYERATRLRPPGTKMDCDLYKQWTDRNTAKQNIKDMLSYGQVNDEHERNMRYEVNFVNEMFNRDLVQKIMDSLPVEYLANFQRLQDMIEIPKKARQKLLAKIEEILADEALEVIE